ncbi:late embryogenesis abundant protein, partial [Moniliophthora roreri]
FCRPLYNPEPTPTINRRALASRIIRCSVHTADLWLNGKMGSSKMRLGCDRQQEQKKSLRHGLQHGPSRCMIKFQNLSREIMEIQFRPLHRMREVPCRKNLFGQRQLLRGLAEQVGGIHWFWCMEHYLNERQSSNSPPFTEPSSELLCRFRGFVVKSCYLLWGVFVVHHAQDKFIAVVQFINHRERTRL